jgi:hypothetical protein
MARSTTLTTVPDLVRAFAERNTNESPPGTVVRLRQEGQMRRSPTGAWTLWTGTEELWIAQSAFTWKAHWKLAPLVWMRIADRFGDGIGTMDAYVWGVIRMVHGRGEAIARGSAMRYLAELPWVPQAMVANPDLTWREVGDRSIEVAMPVGGARVAVTLEFDADGDIVSAWTPARPRDGAADAPWGGNFSEYATIGGVRIPTIGEVFWDLPEGRFVWWRGRQVGLATTEGAIR